MWFTDRPILRQEARQISLSFRSVCGSTHKAFPQDWPRRLNVYTSCMRMLWSLSSNSNSASVACRPNLAEQVHVLSSDLWMEAYVHRDLQLAAWPGDDTEWPGDGTATGDEVLDNVGTCNKELAPRSPRACAGNGFSARISSSSSSRSSGSSGSSSSSSSYGTM